MARSVKPQQYAAKRREILDVLQRLIVTKGFQSLTIQDVTNELHISNGALYHYFSSKQALLDGLVDQIREDSEKVIWPIVTDPHLHAIAKLQGLFDALDRIRTARMASVVDLLRVWYTDDNAIARQKVDEAQLTHRAPLLTTIVHQGIQEGVFKTDHPDQAGEAILSLVHGMGNTHARLLLSVGRPRDASKPRSEDETTEIRRCTEGIIASHDAYMDAIERVLGAMPNSLARSDARAIKKWVRALFAAQQREAM
jgi:AcrR family transcriptional regulator